MQTCYGVRVMYEDTVSKKHLKWIKKPISLDLWVVKALPLAQLDIQSSQQSTIPPQGQKSEMVISG